MRKKGEVNVSRYLLFPIIRGYEMEIVLEILLDWNKQPYQLLLDVHRLYDNKEIKIVL